MLEKVDDIKMETTEPVWIPESGKVDKGKWSEGVTYSTSFILRCPPPVSTRLVNTDVRSLVLSHEVHSA